MSANESAPGPDAGELCDLIGDVLDPGVTAVLVLVAPTDDGMTVDGCAVTNPNALHCTRVDVARAVVDYARTLASAPDGPGAEQTPLVYIDQRMPMHTPN